MRLRSRPALAASSTTAGPFELHLVVAQGAGAGTAGEVFTTDSLAAVLLIGAEGGELER